MCSCVDANHNKSIKSFLQLLCYYYYLMDLQVSQFLSLQDIIINGFSTLTRNVIWSFYWWEFKLVHWLPALPIVRSLLKRLSSQGLTINDRKRCWDSFIRGFHSSQVWIHKWASRKSKHESLMSTLCFILNWRFDLIPT